ncbi:MAG: DUF4190 domain-containing protein [Deltaproteobacteria bacterium]|nr:DUF4190 domain-containing protein [Deltaproteobacteria bacterium]
METLPPPPITPSPSSTSSIVALILGILSLTCCGFFTGIPAIFMGRSEMKAADQGKIAASNRTLAKVGMVLGIIGTALSLGGLILYAVLIAMGISAGMLQNMH